MPALRSVSRLLETFRTRRPMRSTSLIVTLFGDVVSQHGGEIWLGSLVRALGQLGVDERLVRTSTFRLVQDGWLNSDRSGRRSFYRFTDYGRREYERAARRIYAADRRRWDGQWTLLLPVALPEDAREQFRRSIAWQGFGNFGANLYAHPGSNTASLQEALAEQELEDKVVVMQASTDAAQSDRLIRELLWKNWKLEQLAQAYAAFLERYRPVLQSVRRASTLEARDCFIVRMLLIHDWRRVLLRDTDLPTELLPAGWPGGEAQQLSGALYAAVAPGSLSYIAENLESRRGPLPAADPGFSARFGARQRAD